MVPVALALLETEAHNELPIPAPFFGIIAFVILVVMVGVTLSVGKGRPHS